MRRIPRVLYEKEGNILMPSTDKQRAGETREFILKSLQRITKTGPEKPSSPPKKGRKGHWVKLTTNPPKWRWVPEKKKIESVK